MKNICGIIFVVFVLLVLTGTAMGEVTRTGLVAEWHFDGDAKDSSGNGINGTIYGATFVDGKFGKALAFNGINDYVDFGEGSGKLDFGTGPFSIEFWMNYKGTTVHPNVTDIMGKTIGSADTPGFRAWTTTWGGDGSNICLQIVTSTGPWGGYETSYTGSEKCNSPNAWYHVVFVRSGNTYTIYKNGDFSNSDTSVGNGLDVSNDVSFKIGDSTSAPNFNGLIDEFRIYNRALTATEVKNNYEAGQIIVTSSPSGAEVLVNGIPKGNASPTLSVYGVSPGTYTVKCRLPGYSDYDTNVVLTATSVAPVTCSPTPILNLTATPATVTVGTATPVTFNVTSSGAAVSGATVTLSGSATGSGTTDGSGSAVISVNPMAVGTITATASKTNYTSGTATVTANATTTSQAAVTTSPAAVTTSPAVTTSSAVVTATQAAVTTPTERNTFKVTLISDPASVEPGQTSTIILTVTGSDGIGISGADVALDSTPSGKLDPASGTTNPFGRFTSTFTAPTKENATIEALVKKEGFADGKGILQLAISPPLSPPTPWLWIILILLLVAISAGLLYFLYIKKRTKGVNEKGVIEKKEEKNDPRFCMYCKAPLPLNAEFCPKCGKKQEEKKRFCMNCGASMPLAPDLCPRCSKMPPSDVDTKTCKNCSEVIPAVANFCSACGAGQPA